MTTLPFVRFGRVHPPHAGRLLLVVLAASVFCTVGGCAKSHNLASTPNLYADQPDSPYAAVPETLQTNTAAVIFGTDRLMEKAKDGTQQYGYERSYTMDFGLAPVVMGGKMKWNDLDAASRTRARAAPVSLTLGDLDVRGHTPRVEPLIPDGDRWVENPTYLKADADSVRGIHELLAVQLALTPRKEVFLFVHGYNNGFVSSVMKSAQIWHFLGRQGVPAAFSWPAGSGGPLRGYTEDRESGEFAVPHLKTFLRTIASCPDVKKIHVIAHSRGTDLFVTALREINIEHRGAGRDTRAELKLGQVVLAAPDIDVQVFLVKLSSEHTGLVPEQMTLYVSSNDKAIGISGWLFRSMQRVGRLKSSNLEPEIAKAAEHHPVISIVNVTANTDWTGHGYFLSSPAVLSDLILVLRDGKRPGAQHGRPLTYRGSGFWELADGYPNQPAE